MVGIIERRFEVRSKGIEVALVPKLVGPPVALDIRHAFPFFGHILDLPFWEATFLSLLAEARQCVRQQSGVTAAAATMPFCKNARRVLTVLKMLPLFFILISLWWLHIVLTEWQAH